MPSPEPSLPRKKKCHLLLDKDDGADSSDHSLEHLPQQDSISEHSRSRVPDEGDSSLKSTDADSRKTDERQPLMSQSYPPAMGSASDGPVAPLPKTTEYRSQFVAWPRPQEGSSATARKSASMGIISSQPKKDQIDASAQPSDAPSGELWNGVSNDDEESALDAVKRGHIKKTEYKAKFRPFSAYTYVDGSWKKATRLIKERAYDDLDIRSSYSYPLISGDLTDGEECHNSAWYTEVLERLRKADQYRARSHTGQTMYGTQHPDFPFTPRDRVALSPVSVGPSARAWKEAKDRSRPAPIHHRKDKRDAADGMEHPKSREGSTRKKHQLEKTTVRPKSAEPVLPAVTSKEQHRSPKRTRPKAPRDLPIHGHGDLSGRKKGKGLDKGSPVGIRPRAVARQEEGGRIWLKPDKGGDQPLVNGFAPSEEESSVQTQQDSEQGVAPSAIRQPPLKVPLTTVKSPEEVTGVRSPDPESWTVPLEIGKGLHWMDGRTPDGMREVKGPPVLMSKRLKESSLASQKDIVVCDPGQEGTGESVDL
ncbi:uncharacterized protein LOC129229302 isoform X2 [Uloborus diversus]|uniref:uncharacterized protein LOC129229302 isoform X2 n=1 Tax=Uloborus diversus TaxID=327109 RepID=UPI002409EA5E|nr:uncharacterized protein LOC129229302 isoform X2 [Uloborus diversus]